MPATSLLVFVPLALLAVGAWGLNALLRHQNRKDVRR